MWTILIGIVLIDIKEKRIYNKHLLFFLFLSFVEFGGINFDVFFISVSILIVGALLRSFNILGGGDVKLLFCLSMFMDKDSIVLMLILTPWMAILLLPLYRFIENVVFGIKEKRAIAYSVAIISSYGLSFYIRGIN